VAGPGNMVPSPDPIGLFPLNIKSNSLLDSVTIMIWENSVILKTLMQFLLYSCYFLSVYSPQYLVFIILTDYCIAFIHCISGSRQKTFNTELMC
jgi:hypothetical protein